MKLIEGEKPTVTDPLRSFFAAVPADSQIAVCWLGQAGFLVRAGGATLAIDPYLSDCGNRIRGFRRLSPMLFSPEEFRTDYYLITHSHFDHLDVDAIPQVTAAFPKTLFLAPLESCEKLRELAVPEEKICRLDRGDEYQDDRIALRAVTADHGEMMPDAIGVLAELGGFRLYFAGDTAYRKDVFADVARQNPDLAFLPINGRFGNMDAREAARAALATGAVSAVPCHFWTLAEHGGDPGEFVRELEGQKSCRPLLFRMGETKRIDKSGGK